MNPRRRRVARRRRRERRPITPAAVDAFVEACERALRGIFEALTPPWLPMSAVLHGFAMQRWAADADEVEASIDAQGVANVVIQKRAHIGAVTIDVSIP